MDSNKFFDDLSRYTQRQQAAEPPSPKLIAGIALTIMLALIILSGISSSYYTVAQDEEALVLRFGKYTGVIQKPGLHFKLPYGIDITLIEKVAEGKKKNFGMDTQDQSKGRSSESLMLTADRNAARATWTVLYKIKNLEDYSFNVRDVETIVLRDASQSVIRRLFGDYSIDEVMITKRSEVSELAKHELQNLMDEYGCGLLIQGVLLANVDPPAEVRKAFDKVNQAVQNKERYITDADGKRKKALGPAEGRRLRNISEAKGYALKRVNEAEGDVAQFKALLEEYQKAKDITRYRLYLETMNEVLPKAGNKYIFDLKTLDKVFSMFGKEVKDD